jgi:hypothetical protein
MNLNHTLVERQIPETSTPPNPFETPASTCASSSATLKMGIERQLRAVFGDALRGVVQVDKKETGGSLGVVDYRVRCCC